MPFPELGWFERERSDWRAHPIAGAGAIQIGNGPALPFTNIVIQRRRNSRGLEAKINDSKQTLAHYKDGHWCYLAGPKAGQEDYTLRIAATSTFGQSWPNLRNLALARRASRG